MKYLILLILAAFVIRYLFKKRKPAEVTRPAAEMLRQDPVCGAYVQEHPEFSLPADGGRVYFCSKECMSRFQERTPSPDTADR